MPELPEVETIRSSLAPLVSGRRIRRVDVRCGALRQPVSPGLAVELEGRTVLAAKRRAKYLLLELDEPRTWIFHMGMSGRLMHVPDPDKEGLRRHDHVVIELEGLAGVLVYNDPRRFGLMLLERSDECPWLASLGPEPLDVDAFTPDLLWQLRARTNRYVKHVLMDQRVVAGLGNIYVNEILHVAGIRPRRRLSRLTRKEVGVLVDSTRTIIKEAIEHRGSTVSDFLDGIGKKGGYQWRHRVYDRGGQPCPACETKIAMIVVAQRSTFYCPSCQR